MALRGRQHAGGFAIGFAELAVGGARGQATLRLHRRELRRQCGRASVRSRSVSRVRPVQW
jgi:hypothetical protein